LDVVQELDELERARANLSHLFGLFDRIEIARHVVDAAAPWRDDIIEAREITHAESLGVGGSALKPLSAIGCPQQVWSRGYATLCPNRSNNSSVAMPTSGKKASMKQGIKSPMRIYQPSIPFIIAWQL
jgi:hypothetical protein